MKSKIFFLALLFLIFGQSADAQQTLISADEFDAVVRRAEAKTQDIFPGKHIIKETFYENGKVYKTVDFLWQAVSIEAYRIVRRETINSEIKKYEEINIGNVSYRRENDGEWKKEEARFRHGLDDTVTEIIGCSEFSKEIENQDALHFRHFQIGKDSGGLNYTEEHYLIDKAGRMVEKETFKGQLNPRSVKWHQLFIYDYEPNIKIEAPIK